MELDPDDVISVCQKCKIHRNHSTTGYYVFLVFFISLFVSGEFYFCIIVLLL